jgi:hypothetical protein
VQRPINDNNANAPNWRASSAKKDLEKEFANPSSKFRNMSINEIHLSSSKYECYKYENFKQNVDRLAKRFGVKLPKATKNRQSTKTNTKQTKKKDQPDWRKSQERRMLFKSLMDDKLSLELQRMSPEEIYNSHKGFAKWDLTKFKGYLEYLLQTTNHTRKQVAFEEEAFQKELKLFPRNELTNRGYPFWGYHAANALLKDDVKSGLADELKPSDLRKSREEYQDFPSKVFLKHVHQEKRSQREAGYWLTKLKKDAERERDKEAEAMKCEYEEQFYNDDFE